MGYLIEILIRNPFRRQRVINMEVGKLNLLYIKEETKNEYLMWACYTTATETEFQELLDNFLAEKDIDWMSQHSLLMLYLEERGHFLMFMEGYRSIPK